MACNDDYYFGAPCGLYVSKLENVAFLAGTTYYIVIDGYGPDSGTYVLDITDYVPCFLDCPAAGYAEGEPPPVDNYNDQYNSGCGGSNYPFQVLTGDSEGNLTFCGVSGWYSYQGSQYHDTDWFIITNGGAAGIEVTGDAEYATYMFELGPQDCASFGVVRQFTAGPCAPATMTIAGYEPNAPVWFWVGSTVFAPPPGGETMYDYIVWFTGLEVVIANEPTTWSTVKALYE